MFTQPSMTALVYSDSDAADRLLRALALLLMERGYSLAGLVQHNQTRPGRSRCDMVLEDISGGALVPISQDRGPHARGCALDISQLLQAMQLIQASLLTQPQLVILNKFGKTESEGGGFRALIAEVIATGLPLVIAVPWRNIESWRLFAGDMSEEIVLEGQADQADVLCDLLASRMRHVPAKAGLGASPASLAPDDHLGLRESEHRSDNSQGNLHR